MQHDISNWIAAIPFVVLFLMPVVWAIEDFDE